MDGRMELRKDREAKTRSLCFSSKRRGTIQHLRELKQETSLFVGIFSFNYQLKFRAQLS